MPIVFRLACLAVLITLAGAPQVPSGRVLHAAPKVELQSADVILQTSKSARSELIVRASRSPYSHVGLIEVAPDGVFVIEAIAPVSRTPLAAWVARGKNRSVTVLRSALPAPDRARVVAAAKAELGKPYDAAYQWGDDRLYCSELVVKAFARGAGLSVGKQVHLKELTLTPDELALAQRLGLSPSQTLVTPGSLVGDPALSTLVRDASW
jgi:hypothetical protein